MPKISKLLNLNGAVPIIRQAVKNIVRLLLVSGLFSIHLSAGSVLAAENETGMTEAGNKKRITYSPNTDHPYAKNVYWGDTHLHTNLSIDSYTYSNRSLGPEEAYRFAKGEEVQVNNELAAKLNRPLDFLVIADHASNMGAMQGLEVSDSDLLSTPLGRQWAAKLKAVNKIADLSSESATNILHPLQWEGLIKDRVTNGRFRQTVWNRVASLADKHNNPGVFTAFTGYEWTEVFYNLHRVVIFKDSAIKTTQVKPFSQWDSRDPEKLWAYMASYERDVSGEVLAIPHNGNLSNGVMFALEDVAGNPLSADYAKARSRWEPLYEVTQTKGDSESHPLLSKDDPYANYEKILPIGLHEVDRSAINKVKNAIGEINYNTWVEKIDKENEEYPIQNYEYVRPALKLGLAQQAKLLINPFKFGLIGSTDSHTSLSTADESNFFGAMSYTVPDSRRLMGTWQGSFANKNKLPIEKSWWGEAWRMNAAGYAAVWAEENTRESLFAAMKRREVYASTGPRMTVRFFGGWDYKPSDAFKPDLASIGYSNGVPMGGDLIDAPKDQSPDFLIRAIRDPDGANLDRVQVIKGWHDKKGELHEKVYDVALSGDRKVNFRGQVRPVGSTVDVKDASYTNTIGDPELSVVWEDPDFNKDELAFYYVRVLEIPTPRWTAYDVKLFGLKDIPKHVPMVTQERAYTSPIWYSPPAKAGGE